MIEENRLIIKIASYLLQYPDESLRHSFESMTEVINDLSPGRAREILADFLQNFKRRKLLSWQEEYSRNFDLNPATCLNLTYHKYGDGKGRGPALAQLHQVYHQAGYETATGELPDYLPLVLEFLTICPGKEYAWLLQEYRSQVETLANRLQKAGTPYAHLLSVIVDTFPD
jgi:nitrate reductase molybdenum cofactor assembly chaperone NarJ/NarW